MAFKRSFLASCMASALALVGGLTGCSRTESVRPTTDSPAILVKNDLQAAAKTGIIGSELVSIRENLEKLKATDPQTAEALLKDLSKLESLSNDPVRTKAKAKAMMDSLDKRGSSKDTAGDQ